MLLLRFYDLHYRSEQMAIFLSYTVKLPTTICCVLAYRSILLCQHFVSATITSLHYRCWHYCLQQCPAKSLIFSHPSRRHRLVNYLFNIAASSTCHQRKHIPVYSGSSNYVLSALASETHEVVYYKQILLSYGLANHTTPSYC